MEKVIRRWYDLISINSVDGNEINAADYVSKELRGMGLEPHLSWFEGDTERRRPSVWTVLDSGKPGKTFLLIGHIDTVAVKPEQWRTDPFTPTLVDGKVYGRGAMDMKGGDAAVLTALEYFSEHREEFSGRIMACFVSDEEGLSQGTYGLVAEDVIHADYALMAECRYDNVAVGFRGRFSFEVTVKGKSGHASRYPEVGENALISAENSLQRSRRFRPSPTRSSTTGHGASGGSRAAAPAPSSSRTPATCSSTGTSCLAKPPRSAFRRSRGRRRSSGSGKRSR